MADLEAPPDSASLYLARGEHVERLRPILQGDVLQDVEIPGLDEGPGLAMVLAHPCTMRTGGGALRPRVQMARVAAHQDIPLAAWPDGHFRVMPLPDLRPGHVEHLAVDFDQNAPVASANIRPGNRLACLSDYGMSVLQQRFIHHQTRVVIDLGVLHDQSAPNLEEADLLEEWLIALVHNSEDQAEVASLTSEFDALLGAGGNRLRNALKDQLKRAGVRREVLQQVKQRLGSGGI